jgi:flagellar hook-associated protein 3 FlgL
MTMLTRIGDLGQSQRLTASLLANQGRVRDAQLAIATGKAATRYEQLGATAGLLLRVEDSRALKASFVEQNEQLGTRLQVMDAALSGLIDIVERARATLVQRLDAGSGTTIPLDSEADAMLAQIAGTLNTQLGQRYLFAGSRSDTAPVALPETPVMTADPALYYQGDDVRTTRATMSASPPGSMSGSRSPTA